MKPIKKRNATQIAFITHADCLLHNPGTGHPECKERLEVIESAIKQADFREQLFYVEAPLASYEALQEIHDKEYLDTLFKIAPKQGVLQLDPDTVMNPFTIKAALRAAGAVVKAVDLVLTGQAKAAFCCVRPPGHHAESAAAMGFCFFNNLALGVAHAIGHYALKRVAIIDFDVHRGNGTEEIFLNNDKVLICSIYEKFLYPSGPILQAKNIIHIPLASGAKGEEFRENIRLYALDKVKAFNPELLFFSAGFDGHEEDLISTLNLKEEDYFWITKQIKEIAESCGQGRMVSVLEGGYALASLGASVASHIKALLE